MRRKRPAPAMHSLLRRICGHFPAVISTTVETMDKTAFTNHAKSWEFIERDALGRESALLRQTRSRAREAGFSGGSAAQADFLRLLVHVGRVRSLIAVGSGEAATAVSLVDALAGAGQLTAVDSTANGAALIRAIFTRLEDTTTTNLRVVNAQAKVFLPRLNANDYDLIVVSGNTSNYRACYEQAARLLKQRGLLVLTDALAFGTPDSPGGLLNPADRSARAVEFRGLLEDIRADETFDSTLVSVGTGLLLAVKSPSRSHA